MNKVNLNDCMINSDTLGETGVQKDYSAADVDVAVYFKNLEDRLIAYILEADYVVGCVAWVTSAPILQALARVKGVSLCVQKEDFLRPDLGAPKGGSWVKQLREQYEALPNMERHSFDGVLGSMSVCSDPTIGARCVGMSRSSSMDTNARPNMHHKFVVFAKEVPPEDVVEPGIVPLHSRSVFDPPNTIYSSEPPRFVPYAVWTGSFNFSKNAKHSLENALVIRRPAIVDAYYKEFQQVAALSEPLDWESPYVAPEWRIGS